MDQSFIDSLGQGQAAAPAAAAPAATPPPSAHPASVPWWQNAEGAVKQWGQEFNAALPAWLQRPDDANRPAYAAPTDKFYKADLNTPGAQMAKNSPLANASAKMTAGAIPWVAAAAATGGIADLAGLGGDALSEVPLWQQAAGMAGRGLATGEGVNALTNTNPFSGQGLQNAAMGTGWELGEGAAGKFLPKGIPDIIKRPAGAMAGAALGTAASYPAMSTQERQQFGKQLLQNGLTAGGVDLALTLLGSKAGLRLEDLDAPHVADNVKTVIDGLAPDEQTALQTALQGNDADAAIGVIANKMASPDTPPQVTTGAQAPNEKVIAGLKAIFSSGQSPEMDVISKLKAIDNGTYDNPTMQQNNEVIASLKAIMGGSAPESMTPAAQAATLDQAAPLVSQEAPGAAEAPAQAGTATPASPDAARPKLNVQSWAADMRARGADQNVPGPPQATPGELSAARNILSRYKSIDMPQMIGKVWNDHPELQSEFPQVKDYLDEQAQSSQVAPGAAQATAKVNTPGGEHVRNLAHNMAQQAQQDQRQREMIGGVGAANPADIAARRGGPAPDTTKVDPRTVPDTKATIAQKTDPKANTIAQRLRKAYTLSVDTKARIGQMVKAVDGAVKKEGGPGLSDRDNAALLAYNIVGTDNTASMIVNKSLVDPDGNPIGQSYKTLIGKIQASDIPDLEEYMKARRAVDLLGRGKKVYDDKYGITPDEAGVAKAQAIVDRQEAAHPDFKQWSQDYYKWRNDFGQKWLVDSGYLSQKQWDQWRAREPNYIKFQREQGPAERSSYSIGQQIKGSERRTYSFIDSDIEDVQHIVNKVRANSVNAALLRSMQTYPDQMAGWGRIDTADEDGLAQEAQAKSDNPDQVMDEVGEDENKQILAKHGNSVIARVNGKSIAMKIEDPELLTAMRNLRPAAMGAFFGGARKVTGLFKEVTVGANPYFTFMRHIFYDAPASLAFSKTLKWNHPADYIRAPFDIMQAMFDTFQGGVQGKPNENYDIYRAAGGGKNSPVGSSVDTLAKTRQDVVPGEVDWKTKPLQASSHALKQGVGFIENLDNIIYTSPRLAEFKRCRAIDDTPAGRQRALYEANDLTVNYGKSGSATRQADAVIPFLNVGIQGIDKTVRAFKEDPAGVMGKAFVSLTLPTIGLYLMNRQNPSYQKLSQYMKDHYYCIPDPASKDSNGQATKFIKIVKPRALGVIFSTAPEHILSAIDKKDPKQLTNWGGAFEQYFMMADSSLINQPFQDVRANKSYSGAPIVPTKLQALSPGLQYDQNDTAIAKDVGKSLNQSPKQIDYLMTSYLGVIGQSRNPLQTMKSSMIADPSISNDISTNFYNLKTKLDQAVADYKQKGVRTKDYNPATAKMVDAFATRMGTLSTLEKNVQANKNIPQAQKDTMVATYKKQQQAIMALVTQKVGN
jgi:hypothetical protein